MSSDREARLTEVMQALGPRWHGAYRPLVEDLLDMRQMAAERLAKFRENPWAIGSRGQQVEHPAMKEYLALQVRILQLSEVLLLTPRARIRAGVAEPEDEMSLDFLGEELG